MTGSDPSNSSWLDDDARFLYLDDILMASEVTCALSGVTFVSNLPCNCMKHGVLLMLGRQAENCNPDEWTRENCHPSENYGPSENCSLENCHVLILRGAISLGNLFPGVVFRGSVTLQLLEFP